MSPYLPQYFGYTVIAASMVGGLWLLASRSKHVVPGLGFCAAFATIGFACSNLPYVKEIRTRLFTIPMFENTPYLIALQARVDALAKEVVQKTQELAAINERFERLTKANALALENIKRSDQFIELTHLYFDAAIKQNRDSFDRLEELSNDKTYLEADQARDLWKIISDIHADRIDTDYTYSWKPTVTVTTLTLPNIQKEYADTSEEDVKKGIIQVIQKRGDIPKKERLNFLAKILDQEKNMGTSVCAGVAFNRIAGLAFHPLARKDILLWWHDHADKME